MGLLTCPYCSTEFSAPRSTKVGGAEHSRAVCPRCGESVPVNEVTRGGAGARDTGEPEEWAFRPFLAPAAIAVSLFVVVFALGTYAIFNGKTNRVERDAPGGGVEPGTDGRWTRSALLGYLPPDTNALVALQPSPPGTSDGGDPAKLLATLGLPTGAVTGTLDKIGVKPEQVELLLAGFVVRSDELIPPFVVVLKLRDIPADSTRILQGLKAARDPRGPGDRRYTATVANVPMFLRVVDPRTYLLAFEAKDIDRLPSPDGEHLGASLRESFAQLKFPATAWAATGSEDWSKKPLLALAATALKRPTLAGQLAGLRAAAVTLEATGQSHVALLPADGATTARLEAEWQPTQRQGPWLTFSRTAGGPTSP